MKRKTHSSVLAWLYSPLFLALIFLAGCATAVALAETTKVVAEVGATNAIEKKTITLADLTTLTKDLAALPQTQLPQSDNKIIANIVTETLNHKAASPVDAAVVDSLNGVLADVQTSHPPTLADGQAWSILQDAVLGFQRAITLAAPPSALYNRRPVDPNGPLTAQVFRR